MDGDKGEVAIDISALLAAHFVKAEEEREILEEGLEFCV